MLCQTRDQSLYSLAMLLASSAALLERKFLFLNGQ
jgi:hypothetical protein